MTEHPAQANILVVDDTPANLNVLSSILTQQGYKVRPANSGELALMVVQHAAPDLILLDVQMPGLNGFEVCKRLKERDQMRDIPVIFISALDDVLDKVEAFEVGGADYITKPFQILEVLARVEHQLTLHRQSNIIAAARALAQRLVGSGSQLATCVEALAGDRENPVLVGQLSAVAQTIQSGLLELISLTGQETA
jgi:DNA-binding response OmpR family regulator